jgi:hypothetical protein
LNFSEFLYFGAFEDYSNEYIMKMLTLFELLKMLKAKMFEMEEFVNFDQREISEFI